METVNGKSLLHGIAYGRIKYISSKSEVIKNRICDNPRAEFERFEAACRRVSGELDRLYETAVRQVGESNAQIFRIHQMMLEDEDYIDAVKKMIENEHSCAEYAVYVTGMNFADMFSAMDNEYMKARATDIKDVSGRVADILLGRTLKVYDKLDGPYIIAAEDLSPSETVQLDKSRICGFVTRYGSSQSHTAILARTMNIPAIICAERIDESWQGKEAFIDGYNGFLCVEPTMEIKRAMFAKMEEDKKQQALYEQLKGKDDITSDGKRINLFANIGSITDIGSVLSNDAQGIGLFRTEFIFLESKSYPSEEEQFQIYKKAASTMGSKKIIIRTLDIGADKQAEYFGLDREINPALGMRAIRLCFERPELFKTQLRAILRAAAFGNLSVMFPMIISADEVKRAKKYLCECREELTRAGETFGEVEVGIMIETPAAVMISDELAQNVDFFSIGTNDLIQYTLAADRQNSQLEKLIDPRHPAIMRMIRQVVEAGHSAGIWVGVCGEVAADVSIVPELIKCGVDELSVSPGAVLNVRHAIRKTDSGGK